MKKINNFILIISFIVAGLSLSQTVKANVIPIEYPSYYPEVYVYVDNQPVDETFVIRQRHGFPVLDENGNETDVKEYERKLTSCQDGYCYLFSATYQEANKWEYYLEQFSEAFTEKEPSSIFHIEKGQYNSRRDNKITEYDLTSLIQEFNTQALYDNEVDYEVKIDSLDGSIEVNSIEPILSEREKEYQKEMRASNWQLFKMAWPLLIYGIVGLLIVIGLLIVVIWLYRRFKKRKSI